MRARQVGSRRSAPKAAFATALVLAALISIESRADQSPANAQPPKFAAYLAQGYRSVGSLAWRDGDGRLSARYRKRAALAARGAQLAPLTLAETNATGWTSHEAGFARRELVARLEAGARERQPLLAAIAQVNFDCWIAPLPKRIGSTDGDECRRRFYFALAGLRPYDNTVRNGSIAVSPLMPSTASQPQPEQVGKAKGCPAMMVNGLCVEVALVGPTADLLISTLTGNSDRADLRNQQASSPAAPGLPASPPGGLPDNPAAPDPSAGNQPSDPASATSDPGATSDGPNGGVPTGADGRTAGTGNTAGTSGNAAGGVGGALGSAAGAAGAAAGSTAGAAGNAASSAGGAVGGATSAAGNAVGGAVSGASDAAGGAVSAAGNAAGAAASAAGSAAGAATSAAGGAVSAAGNAAGAATSAAGGAAGAAASAAGNAVGGAANAAGSAAGAVGGAVGGATRGTAGRGGLGL